MTALLTSAVASTLLTTDTDVEVSKGGYSLGIVTFYPDGDYKARVGLSPLTLDVIAALLEEGWTHGTTDGYDWSIL